MLTVSVTDTEPLQVNADLLVVPVFKGGIEGPGAASVLDALGLDAAPTTPEFRGDIGETLTLSAPGQPYNAVMFVGLGRMDAVDAERLRRAAGVAAREGRRVARVATTLSQVHADAAAAAAIAEGFWLGGYEDRRFRSEDASALTDVSLLVASSQMARVQEAVARAEVYARATIAARDLVNLPPDRKRPADLARLVSELVGGSCEVTVRDDGALEQEGFGGLLGVGRGHPRRRGWWRSAIAPRTRWAMSCWSAKASRSTPAG